MKQPFGDILPVCCGKRMQVRYQNIKLTEVWCNECDDIVLIRIETSAKFVR